MAPITFLPALGTCSTVHLPPPAVLSRSAGARVLLTFTASGSGDAPVELWTDADGGWRAVPFAPLPGRPDSSVAHVSVALEHRAFGYTYRIQHPSGEVTWLGDMGGNGRVELVRSSSEDDDSVGLWNGDDWLDFALDKWDGFGVHMDDRNIPHDVLLSDSSTHDLSFAYVHPSRTTALPPFATFQPTPTTRLTSTAIALLSPAECYLSTSTASLVPASRTTKSAAPPAAYASYCGLGFAGGEGDRSKAFRSVFGHGGSPSSSSGVPTWEYLPRFVRDGEDNDDEGEKATSAEEHAVALLYSGMPKRLIAYFSSGSRQVRTVQWDCSAVGTPGDERIAVWNPRDRRATMTVLEEGKRTVALSSKEATTAILETMEVVRLFEMQHDGITILLGVLAPSSNDGKSYEEWMYVPEKVEREEFYVDEQVIPPPATPKAVPDTTDAEAQQGSEMSDAAPGSGDSAVTYATEFTSPGSSEHDEEEEDETSNTSIEEVLEREDVPIQHGKPGTPEQGYVFVPPGLKDEGAPGTGDLQGAESGIHSLAPGSTGVPSVTPTPVSTEASEATEERNTTFTGAAAAAPVPRKSFLRFLWITLGFFQSLYFRALSWFRRRWTASSANANDDEDDREVENEDALADGDDLPQADNATVEGEEETTPLIQKNSATDYAATSQRKVTGTVNSDSLPRKAEQDTTRLQQQAVETTTMSVLETRTTVVPAYIHSTGMTGGDVFLLTSLSNLTGRLIAEIQAGDGGEETSSSEWTAVNVAEETVAEDSEMRLVRVTGVEPDSHLRIRLV
ncbi:hypothetical protein QFC19_007861 [Naganishia cerealis]|uniref:Uncharacterized protein n=1 Tax=Naganishia cerealis TaxID=610337 RepID=A0ACC2V6A5_9TREE|nr:hypothetical protein QFC19_007861 [Naganishia cerealis]